MKQRTIITIILSIAAVGAVMVGVSRFFGFRSVAHPSDQISFLRLPDGFGATIFADGLGTQAISRPGPNNGARLMAVRDDVVYVAVPDDSAIYALFDTNGDGRADDRKTFLGGLRRPHNIDFYQDWAYIAAEDKILRIQDANRDHRADLGTMQTVMALPTGGHWTRTVKIIDEAMYVAIGSSCNACDESDPERATIQKCDLNGKNCSIFAKGLRNAVDFISHEGVLYATENSRDLLGNDVPPDEINAIREGGDYGWPVCYGKNMHDADFDKNVYIRDPCADKIPPLVELPAHVAPLGLATYDGNVFPEQWQKKLFIAYHGSWNRQPPSGYKVVAADIETGEIMDFATGWLEGETVFGRPVGIVTYKDGLLISDDVAGKIYYITHRK
ncbi:MAG: PQQ-dependent sugar dehydrogenase [bacterium]|nr:PQQ-dependent sugar dehydrogenase [bacterium]